MNRNINQEEFGRNAEAYIHSKTHARGESLKRMVELVRPQKDWRVLDIATGAGHTAFAFAPHTKTIWATDITSEMLAAAEKLAAEKGLRNLIFAYAEAEEIPFEDHFFDVVTCRIAAHHFSNIGKFLAESLRVLRPGGTLALVDNIVPAGPAGAYVNAFEKLRDPSHGRCLTISEWTRGAEEAGFVDIRVETRQKTLDFAFWAKRHASETQLFLKAMLTLSTGEARAFLKPEFSEANTFFNLTELILTALKPAGPI